MLFIFALHSPILTDVLLVTIATIAIFLHDPYPGMPATRMMEAHQVTVTCLFGLIQR
jgi:hypothetical protein